MLAAEEMYLLYKRFNPTEEQLKIWEEEDKRLEEKEIERKVRARSETEWGYPTKENNIIFIKNIYNQTHIKRHPYHIVKGSMAPIMTTFPILYFVLYNLNVITNVIGQGIAICVFIGGLVLWIFNIIFDSLYDQQHTYEVKRGLIMGMLLFIFSEVMFFFSFFWSYFYISLSPTVAIGCVWPPYDLTVYSYLGLPLINTVILLLSGAILTDGYSVLTEQKTVFEKNEKTYKMEYYFEVLKGLFVASNYKANQLGIISENLKEAKWITKGYQFYKVQQGLAAKMDLDFLKVQLSTEGQPIGANANKTYKLKELEYCFINMFLAERNVLILVRLYATLGCAALFLICQAYEYYSAPFSIQDGIYGSLFYLLTGFHGFHVLVGSILILIVTLRFLGGNFELLNIGTKHQIYKNRSTGFACTLFYWHFVDVVWIFLYIVIYWWGSNI